MKRKGKNNISYIIAVVFLALFVYLTENITGKETQETPAKRFATKTNTKDENEATYLATKLPKTAIQQELNAIIAKGPLTLSKHEMEYLQANPDQLRNYINIKVGNKKRFQEFFIRLAMSDKKQVRALLSNHTIKDYVAKSIRRSGEGGVHEWLMTKNFLDFLVNPKWGKDGYFLALALTKLVQKTENVVFKTGGGHVSSNRANSKASKDFHNGLAKVIDSCSTKEELFVAVKAYAKASLTAEAYKEFADIFARVFTTETKTKTSISRLND